jgi:hypothetical protein
MPRDYDYFSYPITASNSKLSKHSPVRMPPVILTAGRDDTQADKQI